MGRRKVFAKGNLDVRDTLHSLRVGGALHWNGMNEIVRARFPSTVVQVIHETWTRSDALLETAGGVPEELVARTLALGAHPLPAQFSRKVFDSDADAIVFSVQPDVSITLARHQRHGYLFHPANWTTWPEANQRWLQDEFAFEGLLEVEASMGNFESIVARIRERTAAPILVYNMSSVGTRWSAAISRSLRGSRLPCNCNECPASSPACSATAPAGLALHETLNIAALWKLPLLLVCDNNGYSISTQQDEALAPKPLSSLAAAFGIPAATVDGMDVLAVRDAASTFVTGIRAGNGPAFLECRSARFATHSTLTRETRDASELAADQVRDPIRTYADRLEREGSLTPDERAQLTQEVEMTVAAAVRFAEAAPYPDPADLLDHVV